MSYGMQIRLSSGLTDISDVYTARPKEEHQIDKGSSNITLYPNQDVSYGTFSSLGIDFDSSTDAFFVTKYSPAFNPSTETKVDHWSDIAFKAFFDLDLAHTLILDDVNETVKLVWQNEFWNSLTLEPSSGSVILYVEFTIIKIKGS